MTNDCVSVRTPVNRVNMLMMSSKDLSAMGVVRDQNASGNLSLTSVDLAATHFHIVFVLTQSHCMFA